MEKFTKLLLWVVFTVLFGMGPLVVRYLNARVAHPIEVSDTLKGGDLFIVGAVIAADAVGKVLYFLHKSRAQSRAQDNGAAYHVKQIIRIVCACACVALMVVASVEFAQVSGRIDAGTAYLADNVIHDSLFVFVSIVAAGFGVMLVNED